MIKIKLLMLLIFIIGFSSFIYSDVFIATQTDFIIKNYDVNLNYLGQTSSFGNVVRTIQNDEFFIYAGGDNNLIRKYAKNNYDLLYTSQSFGAIIINLHLSNNYIYAGGNSDNIKKYNKVDLSYVTEISLSGNWIYSIDSDFANLYVGGDSSIFYIINKNTDNIVYNTTLLGTINKIKNDNNYIYIATTQTTSLAKIYIINKNNYTDVQTINLTNAIRDFQISHDYIYITKNNNVVSQYDKISKNILNQVSFSTMFYVDLFNDNLVYISFNSPSRLKKFDLNLNFINEIPISGGNINTLNIVKNQSITTNFNLYYDTTHIYNGLFGFYNPALINSNQSFIAKKCDDDFLICTYHIENDVFNSHQKLCTDCGYYNNTICGDWSLTLPLVECLFNETGVYNINFDLYTNIDDGLFLGTLKVTNLVVTSDVLVGNKNLILPINLKHPSSPLYPSTDSAFIQSIFGLIQTNIKLIFALILCLGLVITTAQAGIRNPLILLLAFIVGLVIVTMLNMISIGVLIIMLVTITILVIASLTIFKNTISP